MKMKVVDGHHLVRKSLLSSVGKLSSKTPGIRKRPYRLEVIRRTSSLLWALWPLCLAAAIYVVTLLWFTSPGK